MFNMCHRIKISYIPKIYLKVTWQNSSTFLKNNSIVAFLIRNKVHKFVTKIILYFTNLYDLQVSFKKMWRIVNRDIF